MQQKQLERLSFQQSGKLQKLGFKHAFFDRNGGVSPDPYASLNLKYGLGDDRVHVDVNYQTVFNTLDINPDTHVRMMVANKDQVTIEPEPGSQTDYDAAIITSGSVSITAADCSQILIAHRDPDVCAIVHAGWYGLTRRIVEHTIQELIDRYEVDPAQCAAAIGPTITANSYEIQQDVIDEVDAHLPEDVSFIVKMDEDGRNLLDIKKGITLQFERMGVSNYDISEVDTYTDTDFFSYRRDGVTGRHGTFISF